MKSKQIPQYHFDSETESEIEDKQSQSISNKKHRQKQTSITIKDLCSEDKAKIGQLIKKLADEKIDKEKLITQIQETKILYEQKLKQATSSSNQSINNSTPKTIDKQHQRSNTIHQGIKNESQLLRSEIHQLDSEIQDLLQFDSKYRSSAQIISSKQASTPSNYQQEYTPQNSQQASTPSHSKQFSIPPKYIQASNSINFQQKSTPQNHKQEYAPEISQQSTPSKSRQANIPLNYKQEYTPSNSQQSSTHSQHPSTPLQSSIKVFQSPNFKTLIVSPNKPIQTSERRQEQIQKLFKQNLNLEPSPSFLQSQVASKRESVCSQYNTSCAPILASPPPRMQSPIYDQNSSFQSNAQDNRQSETPKRPPQDKSKSMKKAFLIQKIQEFEKIIDRMNFSKSYDTEQSQDSIKESPQDIYKKLIYLEEELKRLNSENNTSKAKALSSSQMSRDIDRKSESKNVQINSQNLQKNEDDVLIELLNSTSACYFVREKQRIIEFPQEQTISCEQSSVYGQSFLSLIDNIDINENKKKQIYMQDSNIQEIKPQYWAADQYSPHLTIIKEAQVSEYTKNLFNKYDGLISELKYEFDRVQ